MIANLRVALGVPPTRLAPLAVAALVTAACTLLGTGPDVTVLRAPANAKLPQVAIDGGGTVQLIYYSGSMTSGDLFHVSRAPDSTNWSASQQVNSQPHSVTGVGPIDGGQLAIDPDGRMHVAWFHNDPMRFYYTRSDDAVCKSKHAGEGIFFTSRMFDGFEEQQVLSGQDEGGVESGPTVTADGDGNVYVFWHADAVEDAFNLVRRRRVYMALSRDNGAMFESPRAVSPDAEGACGCCGLRAVTDDAGAVHVSYRGAGENIHRGMRLLTTADQGRTFGDQLIQPWDVGACPVATTTLAAVPDGTTVAWETAGQVYLAEIDRLEASVSPPGRSPTMRARCTSPTAAPARTSTAACGC